MAIGEYPCSVSRYRWVSVPDAISYHDCANARQALAVCRVMRALEQDQHKLAHRKLMLHLRIYCIGMQTAVFLLLLLNIIRAIR